MMRFFESHNIGLGPLQQEICEYIWTHGESTPQQIWRNIFETRNIALNTVNTVLSRLVKQDLLHRTLDGRTYLYSMAMTKDEFVRRLSRDVTEQILKFSPDAVNHFVDALEEISPDSVKMLTDYLQNREKN